MCSKCNTKKHKHHKHKKHSSSSSSSDESPKCKSPKSSCKCGCYSNKHKCKNRNYLCKSVTLKTKLAEINKARSDAKPRNYEDCKYKPYHYNGSFHKALQHNGITGDLTDSTDYASMVKALEHNDQFCLDKIKLAVNSDRKSVV